MKSPSNILTIFLLLFTACTEDLFIDTSKSTIEDPISDITFIDYSFYTTNFDKSGHAGQQIDLFKYDSNGPMDRFEMPLNGQGYLAIANDGQNIYLQPRFTDYILKVSLVGELFWHKMDEMEENASTMTWKGSGLTWKDSTLVTLYQHVTDSTLYRARYLSLGNNLEVVRDTTIVWNHLNNEGILALDYHPFGGFVFLAKDIESQTIVFRTDSLFIPIAGYDGLEYYNLEDEAVGLSWGSGWWEPLIYISYSDRRIEPLNW